MEEFDKLRQAATSSDVSEPVAEIVANDFAHGKQRHDTHENLSEPVVSLQQSQTTGDEGQRPVATSRDNDKERETHERIEEGYLSIKRENTLSVKSIC